MEFFDGYYNKGDYVRIKLTRKNIYLLECLPVECNEFKRFIKYHYLKKTVFEISDVGGVNPTDLSVRFKNTEMPKVHKGYIPSCFITPVYLV